ncbi:senataxin [Cryptococcus neoformans]|nr:senataxin [Cryptococcus neoformans var. grubii]OXC57628.1 senataxin [Cryptococcus neoformans var. grubii MW-RSA852]
MSSDKPRPEDVKALLAARRKVQEKPNTDALLPVYLYLLPQSNEASSSSSSLEDHWYCSKSKSALHIEAATYLIFLFAFQRQGTSKTWVDKLEVILESCENCARSFGVARRRLEFRYLSEWPAHVRKNFFAAVDRWQSTFILNHSDKASDRGYGKPSSAEPALYSLSGAIVQLLLGEPSLLSDPGVNSLYQDVFQSTFPTPTSLTALGMTPVHARLLSSLEPVQNLWSAAQLPALARRPVRFSEWCNLGIGSEIQDLYNDGVLDGGKRWQNVTAILDNKVLDQETVEKGLLNGQLETDSRGRKGRGVMSVLSGLLSSDIPYLGSVISCLASLLHTSPTRHIWSFDTSPDLPHTLISELRTNPAFHELLETRYPAPLDSEADGHDASGNGSNKSKGRRKPDTNPLDWLGDYLLSVADTEKELITQVGEEKGSGMAFAEALAVATNMVFQELQHDRLSNELRATAAFAGFEAILRVYQTLTAKDVSVNTAISSTLDLHSSFITTVAFRSKNHPLPAWSEARSSARGLLTTIFQADVRSTVHSLLTMAEVAHEERRRQQKKRRTKPDVAVGPAKKVDHLPLASVRKDLWSMAYDALSPNDAAGAAILLKSLAPFSHIELLDRQASWYHHGLEEAVRKEDWVAAIRAINIAIKATRESFPRAVESLASQADPSGVRSLWKEQGVAKAATTLLLSPDDEIHTPIISIIQQSFDDVDDRADCFRALLQHYPDTAVDGLNDFLRTFIETARITPESCSLAKWLVRCFHDVLEVLCRPSGVLGPLLQSDDFLASFADGRSMRKRLEELWHLMTTSLALIFKRTLDWAPHFENEVMVDWMRDALIFGRQMTDHIRAFEAAVLGSSARGSETMSESSARQSLVGKKMTKQLELVLSDLILWLRLTDIETLFQTHQLIKTILGRISKSTTDVSKNPTLEKTLLDIDKFCRKASRSFTSRLSDDLLSELSELLEPFNLVDDSEVQFVKEVKPKSSSDARASRESTSNISKPSTSKAPVRNAFAEMMKASGAKLASSSKTSTSTTKSKPPTSNDVLDVDDFDDDFLSNISASDLDLIEKRAIMKESTRQAPPKPSIQSRFSTSARPHMPSSKLHVDLTYKAPPKPAPTFQSKVMQDIRREHYASIHERKRLEAGQVAPKLPTASALGSGLGAYTGPPKPRVVEPVDSGSSASDSSDDERAAMKGLLSKQKSPAKPVRPVVEKRSIKVLGDPIAEIHRRNEDRRAKAHATKMRLKPDLSPLYRYILSWDPDHQGPSPPYGAKFAAELSDMRVVPTTFDNPRQYERIMLPLFLQELWSQCANDQIQVGPAVPVEVASRQYEDDFVEIDLMVIGAGDFYCNDSDLVTLRQPNNPKGIFAKIMAFKKQPKGSMVRARIMSVMDQKELCGKSRWQLRKHVSLSTSIREFAALKGLPWYESSLLSDILAGRSAIIPKLSIEEIEDTMKCLSLNEPQAKAVLGALEVKGFALIQGPPGTGKTKTISGLVGKWMSERRIPISVDGQPPVKPKLLVCAPSNAAIDEVCKRLILGVPNPDGGQYNPNIVRVGIDASVNIAVKDVSLDSLVEALVSNSSGRNVGGEYGRIQAELDDVKQQIKDKQEAIKLAQDHDEKRKILEDEYHALITRRTQLGQASSKAKDAARDATRHLDGARRAARDQILKDADIICATLSGAGHDTLAAHTFETVIIDEAAQAIEMSCLIPLKYGCKRCIMVGDPNQLPPTTFSMSAEKLQYNKSLFVRMTKRDVSHVQLLSIQYRMHPFISELPSKVFYHGQLKDGPSMAKKTAAIWHQRNIFGPYRFFNIEGTEMKTGTSTKNPAEALAAVELYRRLSADFGTRVNLAMRIGVISMYREQLWELKRKFTEAFGSTILELVEFNTVDGFQGQEKDIIILSCVRSGPNLSHIGFLKDTRRMNVALTRAKSSLFIFGNGSTLERSDERWKIIVQDARDRGFFINYDSTTFNTAFLEPPPSVKKKASAISKSKTPPGSSKSTAMPDGLLPPKDLAADISTPSKAKREASVELAKEKKKKRKMSDGSRAEESNSNVAIAASIPSSRLSSGSTMPSVKLAEDRPQPSSSETSLSRIPRPPQFSNAPKMTRPPPPPPEDVLFIKKKKKRPNK